jgi:hypothetical protein
MVHKAILIGVNYLNNNKYRLSSPINDIKIMKDFLINYCNYQEDNIIMLSDSPTENEAASFFNIVKHIKLMAKELTSEDYVFMYFSGHGGRIYDVNGDEVDRTDEMFLPQDWQVSYISDDLLNSLLKTFKSRVFMMFDCCNSGTICDLKYSYNVKNMTMVDYIEKNNDEMPDIICCSSSGENANSFEKFYNKNMINSDENKFYGEFTIFFVHALKGYLEDKLSFDDFTYYDLIKLMKFYTSEFKNTGGESVSNELLHKQIYTNNLKPFVNFSFIDIKNLKFLKSRDDEEKERYNKEGLVNKLKKRTVQSLSYKILRFQRKIDFLEKKLDVLTVRNNKLLTTISNSRMQNTFGLLIN